MPSNSGNLLGQGLNRDHAKRSIIVALALAIALCLSVGAASAGAEGPTKFDAETSPLTPTATSTDELVLEMSVGNLTCGSWDMTGKSQAEGGSLTLAPAEKVPCQFSGNLVYLYTEGCEFRFNPGTGGEVPPAWESFESQGTMDIINCISGKPMRFTSLCRLEIPAQSGVGPVSYENVGSGSNRAVDVDLATNSLKYKRDGAECPGGTRTDGHLTAEWSLDASGANALWVANTEPGNWSIQSTPSISGEGTLSDVSCVSASDCIAVGTESGGEGALAERWNGSSWSKMTVPGGWLNSVSCASASFCVATPGSGTSMRVWNGSKWTTSTADVPAGALSVSFSDVSCPENYACFAVGKYTLPKGESRALVNYGGESWLDLTALEDPSEGAVNHLSTVSCMPAACMMTGKVNNKLTAMRWNGGFYNLAAPAEALTSLSCHSEEGFCVGVGGAKIQRWNGSAGTSGAWTSASVPTPPGGTGGFLTGVSCTSKIACTAVGSYWPASELETPLAVRWNGSEWSASPAAAAPGEEQEASLTGVSCSSPNECTAVGGAFGGAGYQPLAELFE